MDRLTSRAAWWHEGDLEFLSAAVAASDPSSLERVRMLIVNQGADFWITRTDGVKCGVLVAYSDDEAHFCMFYREGGLRGLRADCRALLAEIVPELKRRGIQRVLASVEASKGIEESIRLTNFYKKLMNFQLHSVVLETSLGALERV